MKFALPFAVSNSTGTRTCKWFYRDAKTATQPKSTKCLVPSM